LVTQVDFTEDGDFFPKQHGSTPQANQEVLQLEVVEQGVLNAVVFWFDLHLDEDSSITNSPCRVMRTGSSDDSDVPSGLSSSTLGGMKGRQRTEPSQQSRGQAIQYLDAALPVQPLGGSELASATHSGFIPLLVEKSSLAGLRFSLPEGIGAPVPKAPWLVRMQLAAKMRFLALGKSTGHHQSIAWQKPAVPFMRTPLHLMHAG